MLCQLHPSADHIMLGYRFDCPESPEQCVEGSCHDEESHSDVTLARVLEELCMKNIAVFVVRYSGTTPLQSLHLQLIAECAKTALHKLRFPDQVSDDPSPSQNEHSPLPSSIQNTTDHPYGRSSPQKFSGRGGISTMVSRNLQPVQHGKRPRMDYASSMAYSFE